MAYVVYIQDTIREEGGIVESFIKQEWSGVKHDTYADAEAELALCQAYWPDATIEEV